MVSEEYFVKDYPPGALDKLVRVLGSTPFIGGTKDGGDNQTIGERLILIFPDYYQEALKPEGSVYDYKILGLERYQARPTLEQIGLLVAVRREPERVIYGVNGTVNVPSFGLIKVHYNGVKELITLVKKNKGDDANC